MQLLAFLMKLRHNSPFPYLAYRFDVNAKTISQNFKQILKVMHCLCEKLIVFPTREICQSWLTEKEKENFPRLRAIIDCTEVSVARQATLLLIIFLLDGFESLL